MVRIIKYRGITPEEFGVLFNVKKRLLESDEEARFRVAKKNKGKKVGYKKEDLKKKDEKIKIIPHNI